MLLVVKRYFSAKLKGNRIILYPILVLFEIQKREKFGRQQIMEAGFDVILVALLRHRLNDLRRTRHTALAQNRFFTYGLTKDAGNESSTFANYAHSSKKGQNNHHSMSANHLRQHLDGIQSHDHRAKHMAFSNVTFSTVT